MPRLRCQLAGQAVAAIQRLSPGARARERRVADNKVEAHAQATDLREDPRKQSRKQARGLKMARNPSKRCQNKIK